MQIGYTRVSKTDGSQVFDLQLDALVVVELILNGFIRTRHPEEKMTGLVFRLASKLFNQVTLLSFGNSIGLGVA